MNAYFSVDRLCSEAIAERLGWVLVHSLWQFAAVAILAAVIAGILRGSSATARYGVLVIAVAAAVVVPCATWIFIPASGWATLASFPSLRSFGTIEGNPDVFPQLSFSKSLEELEVSWLNDEGVDERLQMSQLKRLHLHFSEMSDTGLLKLAQPGQLTELSLTATKGTITDEGIARLRSLLPNCNVTFEKTPVAAVGNLNRDIATCRVILPSPFLLVYSCS